MGASRVSLPSFSFEHVSYVYGPGYDTVEQPDQSKPAEKLIHDIINAPKDGKKLTAADVSRLITARLTHSKQTNGQFSLAFIHSFFGAAKYVTGQAHLRVIIIWRTNYSASTLLLIFGGVLEDIKPFLLDEKLPAGWSTKFRSRMGLTIGAFNGTVLRVLLGVDPSWKKVKRTEWTWLDSGWVASTGWKLI
jgi:hypothetical protein